MLEYANKKIVIWTHGAKPQQRAMRNSMTTEACIRQARMLIDDNENIVLVECFGELDNGAANREIRFYSEGQWQSWSE